MPISAHMNVELNWILFCLLHSNLYLYKYTAMLFPAKFCWHELYNLINFYKLKFDLCCRDWNKQQRQQQQCIANNNSPYKHETANSSCTEIFWLIEKIALNSISFGNKFRASGGSAKCQFHGKRIEPIAVVAAHSTSTTANHIRFDWNLCSIFGFDVYCSCIEFVSSILCAETIVFELKHYLSIAKTSIHTLSARGWFVQKAINSGHK